MIIQIQNLEIYFYEYDFIDRRTEGLDELLYTRLHILRNNDGDFGLDAVRYTEAAEVDR